MVDIALVTTDAARGLDEDEAPLMQALESLGVVVGNPSWDDATVDWSRFDAAVLRSPWNYTDDLPRFLAWLDRAAAMTTMINPPSIVRWSLDKRYLLELQKLGVPVVPTSVTEVHERWSAPAHDEYVVKPVVGAGSRGARRFIATERSEAERHAAALLAKGAAILTQPYLRSVDRAGENALVFFGGEFSHAINKGPLLTRGGGDVQGLFAAETIRAVTPDRDELALGCDAVAAIRGGAPLYARVDIVRDDAGRPCVLELELAEPSLFFAHAPGSAGRFAALLRTHKITKSVN